MDSPRPFPLSRFIHYGHFRFYYAFGNTQAEDFLQGVPDSDSRDKRPTILSLGCGDIRSCFYTLWKNFHSEKSKVGSRFQGVDFVLNDYNAAVLARNILFLYFCTKLPEDTTSMEWKEWIATVWSIWYNHELTQEHAHALYDALDQLLQCSDSAQEWSQGQLGSIVHFATPDTRDAIRQVWQMWLRKNGREPSLDTMRLAKQNFQGIYFSTQGIRSSDLMEFIASSNVALFLQMVEYTPEKIDKMIKEYKAYLRKGIAISETVLDIPHLHTHRVVNTTLFEQSDGSYTLHYRLVPYLGFPQSITYSHTEMTRTQPKTSLQDAPVRDNHFKKAPLLANTVQQFSMWLTAAAKLMKQMEPSVFTVTVDCSDVIHLCSRLRQSSHSIGHLPASPLFDAIYTSNLIDHVSPAVLVLTATSLLKPGGMLFTSSFELSYASSSSDYLESMFGFSPELFPMILGIRCIGSDGQYSSHIAHEPVPYFPLHADQVCKSLLWRKVPSTPLVIPSLREHTKIVDGLLKLCITACHSSLTVTVYCCTISIETFVIVMHNFLGQLNSSFPSTHQFWEPLSHMIRRDVTLKPHLLQLQTQTLLHDLHMHITVSEADCPLCTGKPLNDYFGQFSLSFDLPSAESATEIPTFGIYLHNRDGNFAYITSLAGKSNGRELRLDFFMPRNVTELYSFFTVHKNVHLLMQIEMTKGELKDLIPAMPFSRYSFMKEETRQSIPMKRFGKITKHVGDSNTFCTVLTLSDSCVAAKKGSALQANPLQPSQMQLKCGEHHEITITYPYCIDPSNVHIKVSNKERSITMTAARAIYCFYNEETTFYVDPHNRLAFPPFHCSHNTLIKYCNLQMPNFDENKNMPLYNAKNTVMHLLTKASSGEKYFSFGYMSEGVPTSYVFVHVHGVLFDQKFKTPVLDLSYCFLDRQPPDIQLQLHTMNQQFGGDCNECILVDDKELELLKKILPYFASITREADPNAKHAIEIPQQKYEVWKFFNRASVYPLYPNIENDQIRHFITQHQATDSDERRPQHQSLSKEPSKMTQDECSLCKRKFDAMKKCARCVKAQYCGKECQRKHWKDHKAVCKPSTKSSAPGSVTSSAASKKQNSTADPTASCTSGNTHDTATHTPLQPLPTEPLTMTQDECSFCKCKSDTMKKCTRCGEAQYCRKECQREHWKDHKAICKPSTNSSTPGSVPASAASKKQNSTADPTASCTSGNTHDTATHTPLQPLPTEPSTMTQDECSFCKRKSDTMKKCTRCGEAQYCGKECQREHWKDHKAICKPSTKSSTPGSIPASAASKKQNSTADPTASCTSGNTHDTATHTSLQPLPTEPSTMTQDECSFCKRKSDTMKKCTRCGEAQYCGKECQREHWKDHKAICKPSTKSSTPGSISASAASKKQNSTADPTANCTSGNTHDTPTSKQAAPTGGNTKWSAACKRCNKQANTKCPCKSVAYCSTECQRLEWPIHKQTCTCVAHK